MLYKIIFIAVCLRYFNSKLAYARTTTRDMAEQYVIHDEIKSYCIQVSKKVILYTILGIYCDIYELKIPFSKIETREREKIDTRSLKFKPEFQKEEIANKVNIHIDCAEILSCSISF